MCFRGKWNIKPPYWPRPARSQTTRGFLGLGPIQNQLGERGRMALGEAQSRGSPGPGGGWPLEGVARSVVLGVFS